MRPSVQRVSYRIQLRNRSARCQMYVCLMDRQGKKLVHTNVRDNDFLLRTRLLRCTFIRLSMCLAPQTPGAC